MGRAYGDDVHLPAAARRGPGPLPAHAPADRDRRRDPHLNPGAAWVSNLSAEPEVFRAVLDDLLRPAQEQGLLQIRSHHRPVGAATDGDRVIAVDLEDSETDERLSVSASIVLDATEEGDLLPLAGCEFVIGAESARDTGEPHALDGPADPTDQQAITWCAALEWRPGENHTIDRPVGYEFWRAYRADFWPGPQLGWATEEPETGRALRRPLFGATGEQDLWTFRRVRYGGHYVDPVPDVTLVNWPQVDYWLDSAGRSAPSPRADALAAARELTLSFVHWLQTEAPRPDGERRLPGLRLRPDGVGTADGLARPPYVRESRADRRRVHGAGEPCRRRRAHRARTGPPRSPTRSASAATGSTSTRARRTAYLDIAHATHSRSRSARCSPSAWTTCSPAGKNLGVTHITNGCYRLHPVEWNVGEAAGALAAFCLNRKVSPRAVRAIPGLLEDFQATLKRLGLQLSWPEAIQTQVR